MEKDRKFGWIRVLAIIIPYLIILSVFQIAAYALAGISLEEEAQKTSRQSLILSTASLLATILTIYLFMVFAEKRKFHELGLKLKKRVPDLTAGLLMGFLVMATAYLLLIGLGEIQFEKINLDLEEVVLSIAVFSLVSVTEELLFRGYIQRNLMYSLNNYIALVISSVLFALAHGFNPNMGLIAMVGLFGAGILLGLSYIYTKNLWFPIALHFSWNLFQTYFGFNVSGKRFYSIIEFNVAEENILNGGKFGFEGSIFSLIIQTILIFIIFKYYQNKKRIQYAENQV